jgi:hypothetical protein
LIGPGFSHHVDEHRRPAECIVNRKLLACRNRRT